MTSTSTRSNAPSPLLATALGAALVLGAAVAFRPGRGAADDPEANLASYLVDHFTGSDAALAVVTRLSEASEHAPDRALFERLTNEFTEERAVVRAVLEQLGSTPVSIKRALGKAGGSILQAAAGREAGALSYFRTLEALLVGVQGKRCLWRALQSLGPSVDEATQFAALEQQALDQWRDIETARQRQVALVFAFPG